MTSPALQSHAVAATEPDESGHSCVVPISDRFVRPRRLAEEDGAGAPRANGADALERGSEARDALPPFTFIYHEYFRFVCSSVRRLGVPPAATDDVVQEIFTVIYIKIDTLRQPESLRSWIYGIARRTVSEHLRWRRVRNASEVVRAMQSELQSRPPSTPCELAEKNDDVQLLWSLLEDLGPIKREVFMLAEIEGMTGPEIAEVLNLPLNTVYSRMRVARLAFEEALSRNRARSQGRA